MVSRSRIVRKCGYKDKIDEMFSQGESIKEVHRYLKRQGVKISYDTLRRYKKYEFDVERVASKAYLSNTEIVPELEVKDGEIYAPSHLLNIMGCGDIKKFGNKDFERGVQRIINTLILCDLIIDSAMKVNMDELTPEKRVELGLRAAKLKSDIMENLKDKEINININHKKETDIKEYVRIVTEIFGDENEEGNED